MNEQNKEYLYMNFGFVQMDIRCRDGWFPLIKNMCEIMRDVINVNPERYKDFEIVCIKEKFGDLRVYFNLEYDKKFKTMDELEKDEMFRIASKACNAANNICEECGSKENVHLRGSADGLTYMVRLCDSCLRTEPERRKRWLQEYTRRKQ